MNASSTTQRKWETEEGAGVTLRSGLSRRKPKKGKKWSETEGRLDAKLNVFVHKVNLGQIPHHYQSQTVFNRI